MLCYKDMTFCTSERCINLQCNRNKFYVPEDTKGFPVAWCDFEHDCAYFSDDIEGIKEPEQEDDEYELL